MMNTPILILIFNRPEETKKLITRLEKFKPRYIYIFSDGPRKNNLSDIKLNRRCKLLVQNVLGNIYFSVAFWGFLLSI